MSVCTLFLLVVPLSIHTKRHITERGQSESAIGAGHRAIRGTGNGYLTGVHQGLRWYPGPRPPNPHGRVPSLRIRGLWDAEGANPPRNLSGIRTVWDRSLWKAGQDHR
ncbi:hypothetical protein GCM10009738_82710 [Kitasatospora viridis]